MADITYNGVLLSNHIRKFTFTRTEEELVYSGIHAIPIDSDDIEAIMDSLRVDDATFHIDSTNYDEIFSLNSNTDTPFTECRTIVEKLGERGDSENLMLIRFALRMRLQNFRTNKFRRYSFEWTENDQNLFTLRVTGNVTGDGSTSAYTQFLAGIGAIENIGKALLGDNDDGNLSNTLFDEPVTDIRIDRHNGDLNFIRTFQQLPDPANRLLGGVENRDVTIIFPSWLITRTKNLRRGINTPHLTVYSVQWTARMAQAKGQAATIQEYETQIQALVISRIKSIFSESDTFILESDEITYSPTGKTATGIWVVSSNDPTVSFKENLISDVLFADSDPVADGKDFTEAPFSLGARLDMTQIVTHIQRGTPAGPPPAPLVSFNGVLLETFLRRIVVDEGNEIVGGEVGEGANVTGSITEFALNWRAEYRAFSRVAEDDFKRTVAGGNFANVQGRIIRPGGG